MAVSVHPGQGELSVRQSLCSGFFQRLQRLSIVYASKVASIIGDPQPELRFGIALHCRRA